MLTYDYLEIKTPKRLQIEINDFDSLKCDLEDNEIDYHIRIDHYKNVEGHLVEDRYLYFTPIEDMEKFLTFLVKANYINLNK